MLLFEEELEITPPSKKKKQDTSATFADNMSLPVHKWYRYTAGFSAAWVKELIKKEKENGRSRIIDPFAGSGTVLIESEFEQVEALGIEAHPYIHKVAEVKLLWNFPSEALQENCMKFLARARKKKVKDRSYSKLITDCYPQETLFKLEALRQTWLDQKDDETTQKFTWFIITSILRVTSPVGTAQWQYV